MESLGIASSHQRKIASQFCRGLLAMTAAQNKKQRPAEAGLKFQFVLRVPYQAVLV